MTYEKLTKELGLLAGTLTAVFIGTAAVQDIRQSAYQQGIADGRADAAAELAEFVTLQTPIAYDQACQDSLGHFRDMVKLEGLAEKADEVCAYVSRNGDHLRSMQETLLPSYLLVEEE